MIRSRRKQGAFTLLEMIVVLLVVSFIGTLPCEFELCQQGQPVLRPEPGARTGSGADLRLVP